MRKRYSPEFKAQLVQELLKEDKTINQIAAENGVHPNQLNRWKATALKGLPSVFADGRAAEKAAAADHEQKINDLYAEIGKLTTQLAWLKKNLALTPPQQLAVGIALRVDIGARAVAFEALKDFVEHPVALAHADSTADHLMVSVFPLGHAPPVQRFKNFSYFRPTDIVHLTLRRAGMRGTPLPS